VTPAVLDRPASLFAERAGADPTAAAGRLGGGRVTLEERLNAALHEARTNGSTECPVCQARMTFAGASGGHAVACGGCGSRLT
jgi:tRNA(Ile2) C34 agmatinyltransferase TiaS